MRFTPKYFAKNEIELDIRGINLPLITTKVKVSL